MYTLLTGKVPPDAPLRQAGEEVLIPPRQLVPVSEHTENAILRALEVDNTRRWQSVSELRAALEGKSAASKVTEESRTVYVPKQDLVSKSKAPLRPSSRVIAVAIGVIAIAACLLTLGIWRAAESRMIALIQTVTPTSTNTATPTFTPSIPTVTPTALPDAVIEFCINNRKV